MNASPSAEFSTPDLWISDWLRGRFAAAWPEHAAQFASVRAVPSANPQFGDYQCNDAMPLAKALRMPPRALAQKVCEAGPLPAQVAKLELAGPGFLNVTLSPAGVAAWASTLGSDAHFGVEQIGAGRTVVIDYSSPNVAKPMHIGHIRSTVIGNALDRLHRALGYRVVADNHIGDWGTQFGVIIMGYRHFLDRERLAVSPIEELERVYVQSYGKAKEDPAWMDACRAELVKLQAGDPDNRALWEEFVRLSLGEFARIYARLGVSFDVTRGESYYNDALPGVVGQLELEGLARESEGAMIVDLEAEGLGVCIVRKRDGAFNYATTDIATVLSRVADFSPEKIVYVTDERQQLHFRQFFRVCRLLGIGEGKVKLEHVWFGLMRLPEGTFSTRQGNVIKLEALLDEAEARALTILTASRPELPAPEARELARAIGIGAVKYADLSQSPQTLVTFTWEKALALDGNSGPYLQYAHARICSVRDRYRTQFPGLDPDAYPLRLETETERSLALKVLQYPVAVRDAAANYRPSQLADYLYDLAQAYSSFYQQVPFLKAEEGVRESRVRLCGLVAGVLRRGLGLLGIETPERI
jgi:arginyl-tRNA synthetase